MGAITPQFPLPLPPWAKWGLRALPFVWGVAEALLEHAGTVQSNGDMQWRRAVVSWTRGASSGTPEDNAVCTFDIANVTGSAIDSSWTTQDYDTCNGHIGTFVTGLSQLQSPSYQCVSVDWYRMQFANPMTPQRRFTPSGPPENHAPIANVLGLAAGDALPGQVAFVVTERTAIPRHWGRFYLPGLTELAVGPTGRWTSSTVDTIVTLASTMYAGLAGAEFFPVVASTQADNVLAGSLLGVSNVKADDIPDIIRRRRYDVSTHTKQLP
jgi:hypothetical protein